jgi:hypothetical protein
LLGLAVVSGAGDWQWSRKRRGTRLRPAADGLGYRAVRENAAALSLALVDSVNEARRAHRGVNGRRADVGMAGELADDDGVRAGVGEVRAERVVQHVRRARRSSGRVGSRSVTADDPRDVARAERAGRTGAASTTACARLPPADGS